MGVNLWLKWVFEQTAYNMETGHIAL